MKPDLTPYLGDMPLNQNAAADAAAFARGQTPPVDSLKDLLMALSSISVQHVGPRLPSAHSAALDALSMAASGLYGLLEQYADDRAGWAAFCMARMWTVRRAHEASIGLPLPLVSSFVMMSALNDLPTWRDQAARVGGEVQAGAYAGWVATLGLLESITTLTEDHAEKMLAHLLDGLSRPAAPSVHQG